MARASTLDFKSERRRFVREEGDISEVDILVDADEALVKRCAQLIEETSAIIRSKDRIWL